MPGRLVELDDALIEAFEIGAHDGYLSPFSKQQSPLAKIANGKRVRKVWEDGPGDLTKVGVAGTVLGSIGIPQVGVLYFVEWDDKPRLPTALIESKLKPIQDH